MTLLNLTGLEAALGMPGPLRAGEIRVTRWAGKAPAVRVGGDEVIFPTEVRVPIVDGTPETPLDVEPTGADWCYRIMVADRYTGQRIIRHVAVPPVGPVDFGDLVQVDPGTLVPTGETVAAWQAAVLEVQAIADDVRSRAITAIVSPDDPRCLRISYPAWASPAPHLVRIPIGA